MNDIMITALVPERYWKNSSNKYDAVCGGVIQVNTQSNPSSKPTLMTAGLTQKMAALFIQQGDTPSTRIIGLKTGTNPDGSYQIKLLGNNVTYYNIRKFYNWGLIGGISNNNPTAGATSGQWNAGLQATLTPGTGYFTVSQNKIFYARSNSTDCTMYANTDSVILVSDNIEELPNVQNIPYNSFPGFVERFSGGMSNSSISTNLKITTDINNTISFGTGNMTGYNNLVNDKVYINPVFTKRYSTIDPTVGYTGNVEEYVYNRIAEVSGIANDCTTSALAGNASNMIYPEGYLSYNPGDYYFGICYDNLHITSDYDKAIAYLNNGTIPDDDEYRERSTTNPNPYDGDPEPPGPGPEPPGDDGQIANNDDHIDAGDDATYNATSDISLPGLNWYHVHKGVLEGFINWFWNDMTDWSTILINSITGLYGNMQNCVISIKKMHVADKYLFDSRTDGSDIKLGRFTYSVSSGSFCQTINSGPNQMKDVGSYNLPDTADLYGFLDYSPYTAISIYLPYVGIVPIDTRYVRGRTITVQCAASYETGEIMYCVKCGPYKVGYYSGKASIEVPFSLESGVQMASNAVNALGNIGASVAMGGALGATNLLGQDISAPTNINSSVTSALMRYGHTKCALIIQKPQHYKLYDTEQGKHVSDYAHVNGYKYNCVRTCHLGEGYAVFDNPHIDTWNTSPTDAEVDEIYSLMKEGIVL